MNRIGMDQLSLQLDGVAAETAHAALDGLDVELARRLSVRTIDPARLFALPATLRLADIDGAADMAPDALRGRIAEALASLLLSGPATVKTGGR